MGQAPPGVNSCPRTPSWPLPENSMDLTSPMALLADCKTLLASCALAEKHRPSSTPTSAKLNNNFLPTVSPPGQLAEHYIAGEAGGNRKVSVGRGPTPRVIFCKCRLCGTYDSELISAHIREVIGKRLRINPRPGKRGASHGRFRRAGALQPRDRSASQRSA